MSWIPLQNKRFHPKPMSRAYGSRLAHMWNACEEYTLREHLLSVINNNTTYDIKDLYDMIMIHVENSRVSYNTKTGKIWTNT